MTTFFSHLLRGLPLRILLKGCALTLLLFNWDAAQNHGSRKVL
jgi:hypothetical protein